MLPISHHAILGCMDVPLSLPSPHGGGVVLITAVSPTLRTVHRTEYMFNKELWKNGKNLPGGSQSQECSSSVEGLTYLPLSFGGKTKPLSVSFPYKDRPGAMGACSGYSSVKSHIHISFLFVI